MPDEQAPAVMTSGEEGKITFRSVLAPDAPEFSFLRSSPPLKGLILHDETDQPWVITVRSDGQLQTAKYPDGEPMLLGKECDAESIHQIVELSLTKLLDSATG